MNKNLIVTAVVVLVVLAAGGGYLMLNNSQQEPVMQDNQVPNSNQTLGSDRITLKDFMTMSGSKQCQFKDAESDSSGEVYIAAGKMRGDFKSKVDDDTVASYMINDGESIYIWMDNQNTGFKTSLQAMEEMSNQDGVTGVNQTVDLNKQVEYTCQNWTIEENKFLVPTEIKFQDIGAMIKSVGEVQPVPSGASIPSDAKDAACAACDNLQGEQRDQCRSALKCN